ncbi:MAG: hypothetical protein N3F06_01870 [Nitrososphaerales archaeon]|nr:hypothetical protein [Nitrososphaerales archaeon]
MDKNFGMSFTEDEVKRAAELKLWIEKRIADLEGEIAKLKETLSLVDSILRKGSFKSAIDITTPHLFRQERSAAQAGSIEEVKEERALIRPKDGFLLGHAFISNKSVEIVPAENVLLNVDTPPFKSFFINRILEGMKSKDSEDVSKGKLSSDEVINYEVKDESGIIKKIVIKNYRDKGRLNEIINTAIWAFTRMLEKKVQ